MYNYENAKFAIHGGFPMAMFFQRVLGYCEATGTSNEKLMAIQASSGRFFFPSFARVDQNLYPQGGVESQP